MLDRDDPPGGEGAAVTDPVDGVDNGRAGVAGAQEVRVQGVGGPVRGDGPPGGDQRLRGDLPAEDAGDDGEAGLAAEDVLLDLLEVEQIEEFLECLAHGVSCTGACRGQGCRTSYRPMSLAMIVFMISLVPP
ncbi:hypothetical protein SHIRM173S_12016 [Streptomyces hirsutus]